MVRGPWERYAAASGKCGSGKQKQAQLAAKGQSQIKTRAQLAAAGTAAGLAERAQAYLLGPVSS